MKKEDDIGRFKRFLRTRWAWAVGATVIIIVIGITLGGCETLIHPF